MRTKTAAALPLRLSWMKCISPGSGSSLVDPVDLLLGDQRIGDKFPAVEVLVMHVDSRDLAVVIGAVIVDTAVHVAAGGVDRDLVLAAAEVAAASLLLHRAKDVEELAHGGVLIVRGAGVELGEGDLHKAGAGGEIARQADAAHAAAVGIQVDALCKGVLRGTCGYAAVIIETEELLVKGRVVGHDADRVLVDVEAVFDRFHHDGSRLVADHPVEGRNREFLAEGDVHQADFVQQHPCFLQVFALGENPGDELKGRDVVLPVLDGLREVPVAREIEPRHGESVLVGGIIVERKTAADKGHADQGIVAGQGVLGPEGNRKVPRSHGYRLLVGKLQV